MRDLVEMRVVRQAADEAIPDDWREVFLNYLEKLSKKEGRTTEWVRKESLAGIYHTCRQCGVVYYTHFYPVNYCPCCGLPVRAKVEE